MGGTNELETRADDFAFVYLDVDDPAIAWLAYRGLLISPDTVAANPGNISWFLVGTIKRGLSSTLRREGALEGFRLKEYPNLTSRLRCVYAYPTLEMANRNDQGLRNFRKENLVAISPASDEFKAGSHDQNWITDFDSLPIDTARKYWSGDESSAPLTECLLSGRFWILGTSVRKRAYETIKQAWPNSLALLELSRLAAEFGSDLGSIAPWLKREKNKVVVTTIVKYTEREGVEILQRALDEWKRDPNFQVNWEDLEPLRKRLPDHVLDTGFCVPDWRPYEHELREDKLAELEAFIEQVLHV